MLRKALLPVVTALVCAAAAAASAADPLSAKTFVTEATAAGMAEIELGRMAEKKADNAAVKEFAKLMVKNHTAANAELAKLASADKLALPKEPDADAKKAAEKLKALSGAAFDRAYMQQMVLDHGSAVFLFARASKQLEDKELRAFAQKTLPTLQQHMKEAQDLSLKVGNSPPAKPGRTPASKQGKGAKP